MLILYAEDDSEDAEVFVEALKAIDQSIGCIVARDGSEALDVLENSVVFPDYIFLDVNMPGVGGRECLMKIKNSEAFNTIPVIIYTTSKRADDIRDFTALGASDYIIKPNTFSEVLACLSKILKS